MLKKSILPLYTHVTSRAFTMPALKTIEYNLIIKEGKEYFKVEQPVLVVYNLIGNDLWYFPNQFKDGLLNVSYRYTKRYHLSDFTKIRNETKNDFIWKELHDRTYIADVSNQNDFKFPIFEYWEFPNGDSKSIILNPKELKQYHSGLGSFSLLPHVGIVNCTLDYYLKGRILFNQKSNFKITSINTLTPERFGELYRSRLPKTIIATE